MSSARTGSHIRSLVFAAAALTLLLAACISTKTSSGDSVTYLEKQMRGRAEAASRDVWYRSLDELLPNARFAVPGEPPESITDFAVVGEVVDVAKGFGFVVMRDAPDGGLPGEFDSAGAMWKTVHLAFRVDRVLGGGGVEGTLKVGVAFDASADFKIIREGFKNLGRVVLFLQQDSPVFAYDPQLYAIAEDGALLAVVDQQSGRLSLPALDADRADALLHPTVTLEELERRAVLPPYVIPLRVQGGQKYRSAG